MLINFLSLFTPVAYASVDIFIKKLNTYIFNPIISLLVIVAVVYFLYGLFEYINGSSSEEAREKGKRHILWGLIGLSIMVSVFFIMRVILGTIGITNDQIDPETGVVNIE
jgi:uncharacterized membrane protein YidH (DUF202 family)